MNIEMIEIIMNTIDNYVTGYAISDMKDDILKNINDSYIQNNNNNNNCQLYKIIVDIDKGQKDEKLNKIYTNSKIKCIAEYIAKKINLGDCNGIFTYSNARVIPQ